MLDAIIYWVTTDSSGLGHPKLSGRQPVNTLAVPMILLCVLDVIGEADPALVTAYADIQKWCVTQVLAHNQVFCISMLFGELKCCLGTYIHKLNVKTRTYISRGKCITKNPC